MGSWMTYGLVRDRNGLRWRPESDDNDPYPSPDVPSLYASSPTLCGDLNRMEQDYLHPTYPQDRPGSTSSRRRGSDPSQECADATGIHAETVRTVLAYVFRESR